MNSPRNPLSRTLLLAVALGIGSVHAQQSTPTANTDAAALAAADQSYAVQQSLDPNVWSKVMTQIMQGKPSTEICAACHLPETVARYQREFGPYMDSMYAPYQSMMNSGAAGNPMAGMMNPGAMANPMAGMMNPGAMANPMAGMMNPGAMANPMAGMMNPGTMMNPMGSMMNPMAMMNPMMMGPAMGMMNPMTMMNPMMMGPARGMMGPTSMMGNPAMGMMNPGAMMNPMMGGNPTGGMMGQGMGMPGSMPSAQLMDPKQYEQFFKMWTEMMGNMGSAAQPAPAAGTGPATPEKK